jgi:endoglycosylceramidase
MNGAVNTTYVSSVVDLARHLGEAGMFTLLDAHQDDLSRQFCGEGLPDFMVSPGDLQPWERFPSPLPVKIDIDPATRLPNLTQCEAVPFALFNAAIELNAAWGGVYNNLTVRQHFETHWTAIASAFAAEKRVANSTTKLLGYELLNEPVPFPLTDALIPGLSDQQNLVPFYEQLYASLRTADPDSVVFYEPMVTNLDLDQPTGFTTGPGGAGDDSKQALAVHVYCNNLNSTGDEPDVKDCDASLTTQMGLAAQDFAKVGGGRAMTEFGAIGSDSNDADTLVHVLDLADAQGLSWMYWNFKGYDDITTVNSVSESMFDEAGRPQALKLAALSRSYPHLTPATPGTLAYSFDHVSPLRTLTVSYQVRQADPSLPGGGSLVAELFGNADIHYNGSATVVLTPVSAGTVAFEKGADGRWTGWVTVTHTPQARGTAVTIVMQASH